MKIVFKYINWLLLNLNAVSEPLQFRMIILCFPGTVCDTGKFLSHLCKKVGCPGMAPARGVSLAALPRQWSCRVATVCCRGGTPDSGHRAPSGSGRNWAHWTSVSSPWNGDNTHRTPWGGREEIPHGRRFTSLVWSSNFTWENLNFHFRKLYDQLAFLEK